MPTNLIKILAINPGSRYWGVALLNGPDLREWRTKTIPGKWSPAKMEKAKDIFAELLYLYQPTVIAMKQLHPSKSSKYLDQLVTEMQTIAKSRGLSIYAYSNKAMKCFFSQEKRIKSRKKLAEFLCAIYPNLYPELHLEKEDDPKLQRKNEEKNQYHYRMFEAVGLGTMCFHQLETRNNNLNH